MDEEKDEEEGDENGALAEGELYILSDLNNPIQLYFSKPIDICRIKKKKLSFIAMTYEIKTVTNIIFSHLHSDHMIDYPCFIYAVWDKNYQMSYINYFAFYF